MNKPSKSENSILRKVISGGSWVFALRVVEKGLSTVKIIILARILSPNDLGLFGIALLTLSILEAFSQTGFNTAIIQKKEDTERYLDSAWSMAVLRGILLFVLLYFLAPYVAIFFKAPESSKIIRVLALSVLFRGFNNIGLVYFQKELKFGKMFICGSIPTIIEFVAVVSFAFALHNIWALIIGQLIGSVTALTTSYLVHSFRPKIKFDIVKIKELFSFGKWIMWSSVLLFFITQGDDVFVGKILGVAALAFYQLAFRIANIPTTEVAHVFSQVTFPAYSKMQDDLPRLQESYLRVLQLVAFLSFPISGLILVLAPEFTTIFLGEKWVDMVPTLQILVIAGLVRSIANTAGSVFIAVGKPKVDTSLSLIRLLVIVVLIYPLSIKWGIFGTALSILFAISIANIGYIYHILNITKCGLIKYFRLIIIPFVNTIIFVLLLYYLKKIYYISNVFDFALYVCCAILIYIGLTYFHERYRKYHIVKLITDCLKSIKKD